MMKSKTSPFSRQPIEFVKRCKIENKCFKEFSDFDFLTTNSDVLVYSEIKGGYLLKINIEVIYDQMELIIDVDKILIIIDNICAKFLVEKCSNLFCELKKGVVFLEVKNSICFNSSKANYNEIKNALLIVR